MATACVARPTAIGAEESACRRQKILRSLNDESRWAEIEKLEVQFHSQPEVRIAGTYPHSFSPANVGVDRGQKRYSSNYHYGSQSQHTAKSRGCLAAQSAFRVCILSSLAFHRILDIIYANTKTPHTPCVLPFIVTTLTTLTLPMFLSSTLLHI